MPDKAKQPRISRRGFIKSAAGAGAIVGAGGLGYFTGAESMPSEPMTLPFYGSKQSGVIDPPQDFVALLAFNLATTSGSELVELFDRWTLTSQLLTSGDSLDTSLNYEAAPRDSGEIETGNPHSLTLTFAVGSTLFEDSNGIDRFGLAKQRPRELRPIERLPADEISPEDSEGDLLIQVCANNQQVVLHAARNLIRDAVGIAEIKWMQSGFSGRTATVSGVTPRNLFGFKDGTANPDLRNNQLLADWVWTGDDEPSWFVGGTYMALRKVRLHLEIWDRTSIREQENTFGRTRYEGAPLSGGTEHSVPDFAAVDSGGNPLIPINSHMRIAHSSNFGGVGMLRRPFNYNNGIDDLGRQDSGLLFIAFTKSPDKQFIPVLKALAKNDALNEYQEHVASGMYAVSKGVNRGNRLFSGLIE